MPINRYLDAAVLVPNYTQDEARAAIEKTVELGAATACVRPCDIELAKQICSGSDTGVCVVLGFPHGVQLTASKADEAKRYRDLGVDEIDMVANYGFARSGMWDAVRDDIAAVVQAGQLPIKVIFETSQLDLPTVEKMVEVCIEASATFVKTSTGFNGEGAQEDVVEAMVRVAAGRIKVKPSGGIRDYARAAKFVAMGADRLGVGWGSCQAICDQNGSVSGSGY
ncbi:MAG TPA: deoxyribose-phosphate aldolase [Phycisphaerales bacterium]|nr:deoxyribose-phosphate aldolase [Phycisphaerales bacterium]HCD34070.1 deoxyribose-phosphate aldolase [Phycisphaerales bacterium]